MNKSLTRNLTLGSIAATIIGLVFYIPGLAGASVNSTTNTVTGVNGTFIALAVILLIIGGIVALVAWIGALIKTAQLQRWGWFAAVFFLSGLGLLIYSFAGPTERAPVADPTQRAAAA